MCETLLSADCLVPISTVIIAICTVVATVVTGIEFYFGFSRKRKTKKRIKKIESTMSEDIKNTLRYFKGARATMDKKIKEYDESRKSESAVFFTHTITPTLQKLLDENSDILEDEKVKKITAFNDQLTGLAQLIVDSKSRAFLELTAEKRVSFYNYIKETVEKLIKAGDEAVKCLNSGVSEG